MRNTLNLSLLSHMGKLNTVELYFDLVSHIVAITLLNL